MEKKAICTWPDGETRDVVVLRDDGNLADIIWNERVHSDVLPNSPGRVVGFDETVPSKWLEYVKHHTGRNDVTGSGTK